MRAKPALPYAKLKIKSLTHKTTGRVLKRQSTCAPPFRAKPHAPVPY